MEITKEAHPLNAFINSGAILISLLIEEQDGLSPFDQILEFSRKICNDPDITLNEEIYQSELRTGDMNRSLAYYLKAKEVLTNDVTLSLGTYFKQCLAATIMLLNYMIGVNPFIIFIGHPVVEVTIYCLVRPVS